MTKLSSRILILVMTRQCNLRCDWCPILKESGRMDFKTTQRAVSLFLNSGRKGQKLIRFFGGEPLLNFEVIKRTVNWVKRNYPGTAFDLTTNGLLLNRKVLSFLKRHPEVEVIVSSGQPKVFQNRILVQKILTLPKVTINFNIQPDKVKSGPGLLKKLLKTGFDRFNFLPAYYVVWEQNEIKMLRSSFKTMAEIIKRSPKKIYLKNLEIISPVPLFNPVPTIDCSGDIFAGNFFLDKRFSAYQNELKLTNVFEIKTWKDLNTLPFIFDFQKLIKKVFPERILHSTQKADRALSQFCRLLKIY
jgi:hypothetical protein